MLNTTENNKFISYGHYDCIWVSIFRWTMTSNLVYLILTRKYYLGSLTKLLHKNFLRLFLWQIFDWNHLNEMKWITIEAIQNSILWTKGYDHCWSALTLQLTTNSSSSELEFRNRSLKMWQKIKEFNLHRMATSTSEIQVNFKFQFYNLIMNCIKPAITFPAVLGSGITLLP